MAPDRTARLAVPAAAALLLWPAVWNGYPIVFADTGTYLSQAIHLYAGWDRPVFYSLFMLPLHATVTLWPVVVVQALLAAWVLWLVCRVLVPGISGDRVRRRGFCPVGLHLAAVAGLRVDAGPVHASAGAGAVSAGLGAGAAVARSSKWCWSGLAALMIASQQSSLPLACVLLVTLVFSNPTRVFALVSWPGLGRPPTSSSADTSKVAGGRAKPHRRQDTGTAEIGLVEPVFCHRHGRACPGHPRTGAGGRMAGTRPAMTGEAAAAANPFSPFRLSRCLWGRPA